MWLKRKVTWAESELNRRWIVEVNWADNEFSRWIKQKVNWADEFRHCRWIEQWKEELGIMCIAQKMKCKDELNRRWIERKINWTEYELNGRLI